MYVQFMLVQFVSSIEECPAGIFVRLGTKEHVGLYTDVRFLLNMLKYL